MSKPPMKPRPSVAWAVKCKDYGYADCGKRRVTFDSYEQARADADAHNKKRRESTYVLCGPHVVRALAERSRR